MQFILNYWYIFVSLAYLIFGSFYSQVCMHLLRKYSNRPFKVLSKKENLILYIFFPWSTWCSKFENRNFTVILVSNLNDSDLEKEIRDSKKTGNYELKTFFLWPIHLISLLFFSGFKLLTYLVKNIVRLLYVIINSTKFFSSFVIFGSKRVIQLYSGYKETRAIRKSARISQESNTKHFKVQDRKQFEKLRIHVQKKEEELRQAQEELAYAEEIAAPLAYRSVSKKS